MRANKRLTPKSVGRRRETAGIDLAGRVPQTPGRIVEALVDDVGRIGVTVDVAATQGRRCRNPPCLDAPGLDVGVHRRKLALLGDDRHHAPEGRNDAAEFLLQIARDCFRRPAKLDLDVTLNATLARIPAEELRGIDVERLRGRDAATPRRAFADDDARHRIHRAVADRQVQSGVIAMADDIR